MANIKHVNSVVDRDFRNRINQLIDVVNSVGISIDELVVKGVMTTERYSQLLTAINGLVKIGEISLDTLSEELKNEIEQINNKVDKGNVSVTDINKNLGKIDQTFLSDELLQQIAGTAPVNAVPADGSITSVKLADSSIEGSKLNRNYSFKKKLTSENLNTINESGIYYTENALPNKPSGSGNTAIIKVESIGDTGSYYTQEYVDINKPTDVYKRVGRIGYSPGVWEKVQVGKIPNNTLDATALVDKTIKSSKLSDTFNFRGNINASDNLNTINKSGLYTVVGAADNMPPGFSSGLLTVDSTGAFVIQTIQQIGGSYDKAYRRVILPNASIYKDWFALHTEGKSGLSGKTIVQFGDSIYGNKRPPTDISTAVAERTGANVFNAGMGGSQMAVHGQYWDATSMYRLADAIATGDWSLQDELIAEYEAGRLSGLPYYVPSVLRDLKSMDFNTVDLITIAHGTNDFTTSRVTATNESDDLDTSTYAGALRYSIKTISEAFPHIKIVVISPMYRFWSEGSGSSYNYLYDSDEHIINGEKLTDYVELAKNISNEYKVAYIDAYNNFGINKHNRHYYFDDLTGGGGTHHNIQGRKYVGEKIGGIISSKF